jgi:hypothetical protein
MKLRLACLPLALAALASAQSSLPVTSLGLQYIWVPPPTNATFFFDMTVNTTVTFTGVGFSTITPVGQQGSMQMWVTNTGITTHVGNEANPAAWTLGATGPTTIPPTGTAPGACFTTGLVMQPGTYGIAISANGPFNNLFANNNNAPQTFSNTELTVNLGSTSYSGFTGGALAGYVFLGTLHYAVGTPPHACAAATKVGSGCNAVAGSFYQRWTTSAAAAAALNGRKLTLLNAGTSYLVLPASAAVNWIPPTAAATPLPANNNGDLAITLPSTFNFPGGSTTQLVVATDGHVSTASNLSSLPGTPTYSPYAPALLDAGSTIWAVCWHNFNTSETGSGLIKWEQVGNLFVITWDGVENWPNLIGTTQVVNPSRFQAQFDLATGDVHYVYQTMDAQGGSPYYDHTIVGFSPGGPSPDVGPVDITTLTTLVLAPVETLPLALTASAAPVLGTSVDLTTSNESALSVGINFLSLAPLPPPGVNLAVIGAPGCFALVDPSLAVGNLISNLGSSLPPMTITLPIPVSTPLLGFALTSQSIFLDPGANAFGMTVSNAVSLVVGSLAL